MTNDKGRKNEEKPMTKYGPNVLSDDSKSREEEFWDVHAEQNSSELHDGNGKRIFDLEERTALFGEAIIHFARKIPRNPVNDRLMGQLVGAGTSVGANYCEADDGVS